MAPFQWDPSSYLTLMRAEIPEYERLQEETAAATGTGAARVLELGIGTGETARRVLARHPAARLVAIDAGPEMLERARCMLPGDRVELRVADLEDPLPPGRFDVVVSALTVHHLDGAGKADLFRRIDAALAPGGRFVLADVVVPENLADVVTPIDGDYDRPSAVAEQLAWLAAAGLEPHVVWAERDLAVVVGRATGA